MTMCKKKFDYTTKWYMHKPQSTVENITQKLLRDFRIQTDYLIQTWPDQTRPDQIKKEKRTCHLVPDLIVKINENEKTDKF